MTRDERKKMAADIRNLRNNGLIYDDIAEKVGLSRSYVHELATVGLETEKSEVVIPDIVRFRDWANRKKGRIIRTPEGKKQVLEVYKNFLVVGEKVGTRVDMNNSLQDVVKKTTWTLGEVYHLNRGGVCTSTE